MADTSAADAHLDRVGIEAVVGLGTELGHGLEVHPAVAARPSGQIEQLVLVVGLPHHIDRVGTWDGDLFVLSQAPHEPRAGPDGRLVAEQAAQTADPATAAAPEAVPAAAVGVDVQRRVVVLVEGAEVVAIALAQLDAGPAPGVGDSWRSADVRAGAPASGWRGSPGSWVPPVSEANHAGIGTRASCHGALPSTHA